MKYALVILVVMLGFWLWKKNRVDDVNARRKSVKKSPHTPSSDLPPQLMLSCAVCGVHLPQTDVHVGKRGSYCSSAHRQQQEG